MKKLIVTYGLIAGVVVAAMMFITMPLHRSGVLDMQSGQIVGYASMIVAFSTIFFAIKSYRDQHSGGTISFGKGVTIGVLITLVASFVYVIAWEICLVTVAPDFIQYMETQYVNEAIENGESNEEIVKAKNDMAELKDLYKIPAIRYGMTFLEIFPVGLLITLISAALLRKKSFLPTESDVRS
jgi:hypothetical protein